MAFCKTILTLLAAISVLLAPLKSRADTACYLPHADQRDECAAVWQMLYIMTYQAADGMSYYEDYSASQEWLFNKPIYFTFHENSAVRASRCQKVPKALPGSKGSDMWEALKACAADTDGNFYYESVEAMGTSQCQNPDGFSSHDKNLFTFLYNKPAIENVMNASNMIYVDEQGLGSLMGTAAAQQYMQKTSHMTANGAVVYPIVLKDFWKVDADHEAIICTNEEEFDAIHEQRTEDSDILHNAWGCSEQCSSTAQAWTIKHQAPTSLNRVPSVGFNGLRVKLPRWLSIDSSH